MPNQYFVLDILAMQIQLAKDRECETYQRAIAVVLACLPQRIHAVMAVPDGQNINVIELAAEKLVTSLTNGNLRYFSNCILKFRYLDAFEAIQKQPDGLVAANQNLDVLQAPQGDDDYGNEDNWLEYFTILTFFNLVSLSNRLWVSNEILKKGRRFGWGYRGRLAQAFAVANATVTNRLKSRDKRLADVAGLFRPENTSPTELLQFRDWLTARVENLGEDGCDQFTSLQSVTVEPWNLPADLVERARAAGIVELGRLLVAMQGHLQRRGSGLQTVLQEIFALGEADQNVEPQKFQQIQNWLDVLPPIRQNNNEDVAHVLEVLLAPRDDAPTAPQPIPAQETVERHNALANYLAKQVHGEFERFVLAHMIVGRSFDGILSLAAERFWPADFAQDQQSVGATLMILQSLRDRNAAGHQYLRDAWDKLFSEYHPVAQLDGAIMALEQMNLEGLQVSGKMAVVRAWLLATLSNLLPHVQAFNPDDFDEGE